MKPLYPFKTVLLMIGSIAAILSAEAKSSIEMINGSGPSGNGSTIVSPIITFKENTDNPTGNTFVPYTAPTVTATFSVSNQQYTISNVWQSSRAVLVFGGTVNPRNTPMPGFRIYTALNAVGGSNSNVFTSAGSPQAAGTGISASTNYGVELFTSAMGLYNAGAATNGRYY